MKLPLCLLAAVANGGFWGRKEKIKLEKLVKLDECERRTRNGDQLFVHFWGMKEIGGDVFQTSMVGHKFKHEKLADYNKPYRFQLGLGEVIQGWDEGLVGMCIGEKWRLFIPASLAYGAEGGGTPETGINTTPGGDLIYEIELIHAEQGPRHPEVFDMMDLDADGKLTRAEITTFVHAELQKQGEMTRITDEEEEEMISQILKIEDKDGDGQVSRAEFAGVAHTEF